MSSSTLLKTSGETENCDQKMAFLTRLSWRFLYCCALFFVSVSVVYTTNILFITPLASAASKTRFRDALPNTVASSGFAVSAMKRAISKTKVQNTNNNGRSIIPRPAFPLVTERDLIARAAVAPTFDWVSSQFTLQHGLGHVKPIKINEKTILSKAFSSSAGRHPSNVQPYFYRASGLFNQDDITITTIITSNRFEVFARLVKKYRGWPDLGFCFFSTMNDFFSVLRTYLSHCSCQGRRRTSWSCLGVPS